jgi:cell division protein FtsQ
MILNRQSQAPYAAPQHPTPPSVVWMRRGTLGLMMILALLLLVGGLKLIAQSRWFAIERIGLAGDTQFHGALTVRANVLPQLTGNYFTIDLRQAQKSFEALPWIRAAVVQRVFPNQLHIHLTAHAPAARWASMANSGAEQQSAEAIDIERLVNVQGELFEASGGAVDTDELPLLTGPDERAAEIWSTYQQLKAMLTPQQMQLESLALTTQSIWQAKLDNGAALTLGGGTGAEALVRTTQWLAHWPAAQAQLKATGRELQSVDLRYAKGFAVRIAGITTR